MQEESSFFDDEHTHTRPKLQRNYPHARSLTHKSGVSRNTRDVIEENRGRDGKGGRWLPEAAGHSSILISNRIRGWVGVRVGGCARPPGAPPLPEGCSKGGGTILGAPRIRHL